MLENSNILARRAYPWIVATACKTTRARYLNGRGYCTSYRRKPVRHLDLSKRLEWVLVTCFVLGVFAVNATADVDEADEPDAFEQRDALIEKVRQRGTAALPTLLASLQSEQEAVRRTAARLIVHLGEPAHEALGTAFEHDDANVRYHFAEMLANRSEVEGVAQHVEALVTDPDVFIRLHFYGRIVPQHFLVDGRPSDELIEQLDATYEDARDPVRTEIVDNVARLKLTDASAAFLRKVSDRDKAHAAVEIGATQRSLAEQRSLTAIRAILREKIERMRSYTEARQWQRLVDEFADEDIAAWPETEGRGREAPGLGRANEPVEALYRLARAYSELGQGEQAERAIRRMVKDDRLGVAHGREQRFYERLLNLYRRNYRENLRDDAQVAQTYAEMALNYANRVAGRSPSQAREGYERVLELEDISPALKERARRAIEKLDAP